MKKWLDKYEDGGKINLNIPEYKSPNFYNYKWSQVAPGEGNFMAGAGAGNKKGGIDLFGITPISKNTRQYWPGMFSSKVNYNVNDRLNISGGAQFEKDKITPEIGLKYKFQDGGTTPEFEPTLKLFTDKAEYDKAFQMYSDSLLLNQEMFTGESAAGGAAYDRLTAANKEKPGEDADGLSVSRFPDPRMKPVFKEVYKEEPKEITKTYTDRADFEQAMQMYNDSLYLSDKSYKTYKSTQGVLEKEHIQGEYPDGRGSDAEKRLEEINKTEYKGREYPLKFGDSFDEDVVGEDATGNLVIYPVPNTKPVYDDSAEKAAAAAKAKAAAETKAKKEKFSSIGGSVLPVVMAEDTTDLRGYKFRTKYGEKFVPIEDKDTLDKYVNLYGLELPKKAKGGNIPSSLKNTYNNWLDKL